MARAPHAPDAAAPSPPAWAFAAALALRLAHLATASAPSSAEPILDADTYDALATALARGEGFPDGPFLQPPGYPLVLAGLYLLGGSHGSVRLFQAILGAWTAALAARASERVSGSARAGLVAGLACALYGPLVLYAGELLPTTLGTFLAFATLEIATRPPVRGQTILSALSAGACALVLPAAAVTAVPAALVLASRGRRHALGFIGVFAAIVTTGSAVNAARGGGFAVSSNAGMNLAIGNAPDAEAREAIRPGEAWEAFVGRPARAGLDGLGAHDRWFRDEAAAWCRDEPVACARNLARKARWLLASRELPRNESLDVVRVHAPVLAALTPRAGGAHLPYALLLPLAVMGLVLLASTRRREAWPWVLGAALLASVPVFFFVTGRYRAPLAPVLCVLASGAALWRTAGAAGRGVALLVALAAGLVATAPLRVAADEVDFEAEEWFQVAGRRGRRGEVEGAVAAYRAALARRPAYPEAVVNLALALEHAGRPEEALVAWRRGAEELPSHPRVLAGLGAACLSAGEPESAREAYRRLYERDRAAGVVGLAIASALAGDLEAASRLRDEARALGLDAGTATETIDQVRALLVDEDRR